MWFFNLPHIDRATGTATTSDGIHSYFTKIARDNYLWQLVTFPTRINNILDLILTNVPDKRANLEGFESWFEDIINTDHKILSFELVLRIRRVSKAKRTVYNFKRANWPALKELLLHTPWDLAFYPNDINKSRSTWTELLLLLLMSTFPSAQSEACPITRGLTPSF